MDERQARIRSAPAAAKDLLALARRDRGAAERALAALPVEGQVAAVCEAPVAARAELLGLLASPEEVIPLLPEAELCFTVKAIGLHDAAWLLDHATPEQVIASVDLDAWSGPIPDRAALGTWIDALCETRDEQLLTTVRALDPELVVLLLRDRLDVSMKPPDDNDWQPPVGGQTLEGVFYYSAKSDADDLASITKLLRTLFESDYWMYFRMLQGAIWELDSEIETWAERWRAGRLEDLGFPPWDEAMEIYKHIRPERLAEIAERANALDVGAWHLPVWVPELPAAPDDRRALYRAIDRLDGEERSGCFYALVALANKLAVADRLPLSDAESTPRALEKAVHFVDAGLEFIARERDLAMEDVLRRVPLERLFGVGANLDPDAAKPPAPAGDDR